MLIPSPLIMWTVIQVIITGSHANQQATDPVICQYINQDGCQDPMVFALCILKCAPPDPVFCQYINPDGCLEPSVKALCPHRCDLLDHELCQNISPDECVEPSVKELCPKKCNQLNIYPQICQYINPDECVEPSVKKLCPLKCEPLDPPICVFINQTGCVEEPTVKALCPHKCHHHPACREEDGFYYQISTQQCFKWYGQTKMNWTQASDFCNDTKLILAHPIAPSELRVALVARYGQHNYQASTWVNNHYEDDILDGNFLWQDDDTNLPVNSSLWWPGPVPDKRPTDNLDEECVILMVWEERMEMNAETPYFNIYCDDLYYPLCELPEIILD